MSSGLIVGKISQHFNMSGWPSGLIPCSLIRSRLEISGPHWGHGFESHFWQILFNNFLEFLSTTIFQLVIGRVEIKRGYSSVVEHPAAVRQVLGSTPSVPYDEVLSIFIKWNSLGTKIYGPNRELNPGPPAPKAGIIPLDHLALFAMKKDKFERKNIQ